jgi:UDP-GlcNAc:undecaprenyl-phosphate/decaprenyl-phosphate GlcNAc-1-phosphate transferase
MTQLLIFCVLSFISSLLFIRLIRTIAYKKKWLAKVQSNKWHTKPIALHGGVGFFIPIFILGIIASILFAEAQEKIILTALFAGTLGMFLVGLLDDIYSFRPSTKLISQVLCASFFILGGGYFNLTDTTFIDLLITYLWFIGIINAINLLDNMDGLASGISIIAGVVLFSLALLSGLNPLTPAPLLTIIMVSAMLAFWLFNRFPATIFMGDSGSLFLGYFLAAMAIPSVLNHNFELSGTYSMMVILIPATVLAIPIFDTTLVTIARKFSGQKISQGGVDHSSHRLVGLGFSESTSINILYFQAGIGGIVAVLMIIYPHLAWMLFLGFIVYLLLIGIYLGRIKVYPQTDQTDKWTPIISNVMFKKRAGEVFLDFILISLSYSVSIVLLSAVIPKYMFFFKESLPIIILTTIPIFFLQGVYRGVWHLIAIEDVFVIVRAVLLSTIASYGAIRLLFENTALLNIFYIYGITLFVMIIGARLSMRLFDMLVNQHTLNKRPYDILLYGAGIAGKLTVDEILRNAEYYNLRPIGFIDDDKGKVGRHIAGIKVIGESNMIPKIFNKHPNIKEVWISSRHIDPTLLQPFTSLFKSKNIILKKFNFDVISITHPGTPSK